MKHNLVNFTRGSQLLGHFGFMFAAGLKGPAISANPPMPASSSFWRCATVRLRSRRASPRVSSLGAAACRSRVSVSAIIRALLW